MSSLRVILNRLALRELIAPRRLVHATSSVLDGTKLYEVGKFETVKLDGQYDVGQFFIHRIFGYRGVILFHWLADVYDRDKCDGRSPQLPAPSTADTANSSEDSSHFIMEQIKKLQVEKRLYYQTLIDHRDFPYIRSQPESITFLATSSSSNVISIPGLDYVSHDDVLPYTNTSQFQHELFGQFFAPSTDTNTYNFVPRDILFNWRDQNHQWLSLTDVHIETTNGIRVTIMPFYMGVREGQHSKVHWWRYSVRLENSTQEHVQLRERHWRIYSSHDTLETIKGKGVIGQEPVLSPGSPAFQYSSHVSLQAPNGFMWGTFRMETHDGKTFDVRIPSFALDKQENA